MKKIIIIMLMIPIFSYAKNWNRVINAIVKVESENNVKAIGSGNSVGLLQIRPILVEDCNKILRRKKSSKRFTLKDRFCPIKSKEMFVIYQQHYNPESDVEKAIRLWNGGPNFTKAGTQEYFKKVKSKL